MMIKQVKYKGKSLNCLKFKRIIGRNGVLLPEDIHVVMTNVELSKLYESLNERFGTEQFLSVKVPMKKVAPKPAPKPKKETVALFGCFDQEIEV